MCLMYLVLMRQVRLAVGYAAIISGVFFVLNLMGAGIVGVIFEGAPALVDMDHGGLSFVSFDVSGVMSAVSKMSKTMIYWNQGRYCDWMLIGMACLGVLMVNGKEKDREIVRLMVVSLGIAVVGVLMGQWLLANRVMIVMGLCWVVGAACVCEKVVDEVKVVGEVGKVDDVGEIDEIDEKKRGTTAAVMMVAVLALALVLVAQINVCLKLVMLAAQAMGYGAG
jgi:hypothetical protein